MTILSDLLTAHGIPALLKHSHALIALIGSDGKLVEWNPSFEALITANPSVGNVDTLLTPHSRPAFDHLIRSAIEQNVPTHGALLLITTPGGEVEYDCTFIPASNGRLLLLAEPVAFDPSLAERYQRMSRMAAQLEQDHERTKQTLLKKQKEIDLVVTQAHEVANTDALTFLPNRRQIIGDLQREVLYSNRYRTTLSISMLDLDHFKVVNDTYGHVVGDQVLRQVANHLQDNIREPDEIGRYGGEEFLVLLPHTPVEAAAEQAERLCRKIREIKIPVPNADLRVTISIGIAQFRTGQEDWQKFLERADAALYDAKAEGRDRWAVAK
jgi:diguanylate cyclase (GGDEF)-like protein